MTPTEQEVLRICRSRRLPGVLCMRDVPSNPMPDYWIRHPNVRKGVDKVCVVDNNRWDSPVIAAGGTWEEVLAQLQAM